MTYYIVNVGHGECCLVSMDRIECNRLVIRDNAGVPFIGFPSISSLLETIENGTIEMNETLKYNYLINNKSNVILIMDSIDDVRYDYPEYFI